MFEINDSVKTISKIIKKDYDILKQNNIKPGSIGEVIDITVKVRFGSVVVELNESSLEYNNTKKQQEYNSSVVDNLMNMFGMRK